MFFVWYQQIYPYLSFYSPILINNNLQKYPVMRGIHLQLLKHCWHDGLLLPLLQVFLQPAVPFLQYLHCAQGPLHGKSKNKNICLYHILQFYSKTHSTEIALVTAWARAKTVQASLRGARGVLAGLELNMDWIIIMNNYTWAGL